MQCFAIACLVTVLWVAVGYSLAFADGRGARPSNALIGGLGRLFIAA